MSRKEFKWGRTRKPRGLRFLEMLSLPIWGKKKQKKWIVQSMPEVMN
jgi:hypothetical protein